jgi:hypothetical protein
MKWIAAGLMFAFAAPVPAQDLDLSQLDLSQLDLSQLDLSQLDPSALLANAGDVLMRAPDADIDALFQAVHAASRIPGDARVLCTLFDPQSDRSPEGLMDAAGRLGTDSRQRFGMALADIASGGLQNPRQPYDAAAAKQTLKSAAVSAMLLHDGFAGAMSADGDDQASRDARCRAFGWVLDALQALPMTQRAAATRLLLNQGLSQLDVR